MLNDEIKKEIVLHGPVVSESFQLENAFLKEAGDCVRKLEASLVDQNYVVLLVG